MVLSQGAKRKFTATRKRKTRKKIVPVEDGPEFCMEDEDGQTRVHDKPDCPEFYVKDEEGQTRVQNKPDGPEFYMKDKEG